jgi:hypothetical protein
VSREVHPGGAKRFKLFDVTINQKVTPGDDAPSIIAALASAHTPGCRPAHEGSLV